MLKCISLHTRLLMSTFHTWHPKFQWHGSLGLTSPCQRFVLPLGVLWGIQPWWDSHCYPNVLDLAWVTCCQTILWFWSCIWWQYFFLSESWCLIRLYLILPSNMSAVCCLITRFLSSSGNCTALKMTILFGVHEPASVLILWVFSSRQGLHNLSSHFRLMKVMVKPGLKSTLDKVHQHTPKMVLPNRIPRGVSLFLSARLAAVPYGTLSSASASITGKVCLTVMANFTFTILGWWKIREMVISIEIGTSFVHMMFIFITYQCNSIVWWKKVGAARQPPTVVGAMTL